MIGMAYKDFMVMRKQLAYYLMLVLIYSALVVAGMFGVFILPSITVIITMMLPMSVFAIDDTAHWDTFAAATPAGRRGVVAGRYLFTLLILVGCMVLITAVLLLLCLAGLVQEHPAELLAITLLCAPFALLLAGVLLPLLFKFGAEKSRIITLSLFAVCFGCSALAGPLLSKLNPTPRLSALLSAAGVLVCIGLFIISYFISQGIYRAKELS